MMSLVLVTLFAGAAVLSLSSIALSIRRYGLEVLALHGAIRADVPVRHVTWRVREPARSLALPAFVSLRAPRTTYRRLASAVTIQAAVPGVLRAA